MTEVDKNNEDMLKEIRKKINEGNSNLTEDEEKFLLDNIKIDSEDSGLGLSPTENEIDLDSTDSEKLKQYIEQQIEGRQARKTLTRQYDDSQKQTMQEKLSDKSGPSKPDSSDDNPDNNKPKM